VSGIRSASSPIPSDAPYFFRVEEDEIEKQVDELRQKLLANLRSFPTNAKSLKAHDTHGLAAAKQVELDRMAAALGTRRPGYVEGEAFDREKQEENKQKRIIERAERERKREEDREKWRAQKEKWEARRGRRTD
jgi:serine/arginine repetitive matrix protein 2